MCMYAIIELWKVYDYECVYVPIVSYGDMWVVKTV
jgi:hypothetical protein